METSLETRDDLNKNLSPDQSYAYDKFKEFLVDEESPAIVISGIAGTGKTFLTSLIANYLAEKRYSVAAIAPTHKARRVIEHFLNTDRFISIPTFTVASVLGKMREHTYIGSHKYSSGSTQKMDSFGVFIVDEISMISDKDMDEIIEYICLHDKKLILIGDNCQLPSPSQPLVKTKDEDGSYICYKADSSAFDICNRCELMEIVRQRKDSPIIKIAAYIRDNIATDISLDDILEATELKNELCMSIQDAYRDFVKEWNSKKDVRLLSYTNASVQSHNREIRKRLQFDNEIVLGELLTGYNNVGWPVPLIENGTDYRVISIRKSIMHTIGGYGGLVGSFIDLEDVVSKNNTSKNLFFIDIRHPQNAKFMAEFVYRAEKVNTVNSLKDDYKKYCQLKNRAVFMDNVYKFGKNIMGEHDFKQLHPLLFSKVSEVIDTNNRVAYTSVLSQKLEEQYGDIIQCRIVDNKPFADGEVFADHYMVVERDIYYGYALTVHKSQGSTYDITYVDSQDLRKISNKWNWKHKAMEYRFRERNQLTYVAYTRASDKLRIIV